MNMNNLVKILSMAIRYFSWPIAMYATAPDNKIGYISAGMVVTGFLFGLDQVIGWILGNNSGEDSLTTKPFLYAVVTMIVTGLMFGFGWFPNMLWVLMAGIDMVVSFFVIFLFFEYVPIMLQNRQSE